MHPQVDKAARLRGLGGSWGRLALGIFLILLLVWHVGLFKVVAVFARINPLWIAPLIVFSYLGIIISCARWQLFLDARGIAIRVHRLAFYYVIGYFFSNLLPGMFGGDILRGWILGKRVSNKTEVFASVFMERLSGVAGLMCVALVASLFHWQTLRESGLMPYMFIALFSLLVFIILIYNKALVMKAGSLVKWKKVELWKTRLLRFHDAVYFFRNQKKTVAMAFFCSIVFHILTSVNTFIICLALHIHVNFLDIMVTMPLIFLLSAIPLTPSATGVWEFAFIFFFSHLGMAHADALSIGLMLRAKNICVSILGGLFYLFIHGEVKQMVAAKV